MKQDVTRLSPARTTAMLAALAGLIMIATACNQPRVINDLSDRSYPLIDQDSSSVVFPGDYRGDVLVVGFIYTHCPDVCPMITANMKKIHSGLQQTEGVRFLEITFDPGRDTPDILKQYMNSFELDPGSFSMLTGDTTAIDSLMHNLDILVQKSYSDTTGRNQQQYLITHTNRIILMDPQGRVRYEYMGSRVPPDQVIEGINQLR